MKIAFSSHLRLHSRLAKWERVPWKCALVALVSLKRNIDSSASLCLLLWIWIMYCTFKCTFLVGDTVNLARICGTGFGVIIIKSNSDLHTAPRLAVFSTTSQWNDHLILSGKHTFNDQINAPRWANPKVIHESKLLFFSSEKLVSKWDVAPVHQNKSVQEQPL